MMSIDNLRMDTNVDGASQKVELTSSKAAYSPFRRNSRTKWEQLAYYYPIEVIVISKEQIQAAQKIIKCKLNFLHCQQKYLFISHCKKGICIYV